MTEMIGELRALLSAMDYMIAMDEDGELPHDIDFHYVLRELIKSAKARMTEKNGDLTK